VDYAEIHHLSTAGLNLNSASGKSVAFDYVTFKSDAESVDACYMNIAGSAWNKQTLRGLGFEKGAGQKFTASISKFEDNSYGQVLFDLYSSGVSYISGDATDVDDDGNNGGAPGAGGGPLTRGYVHWTPTAAVGLTATADRAPKGVLVGWQALSERETGSYEIWRRKLPAGRGLEDEPQINTDGHRSNNSNDVKAASIGVHPCSSVADVVRWQKLAEVPATAFAGEPTGSSYRWLDESAGAGERFEYRIREIEGTGRYGSRANAVLASADPPRTGAASPAAR
jgi:hypothetical protein